jgi:hypothetical protein
MNCGCNIYNFTKFAYVSIGDFYDSNDVSNFEILCPRHHPFFYFFAGIMHINYKIVHDIVLYAHMDKNNNTLKVIMLDDFYNHELFISSLNKAWNIYNEKKNLMSKVYEIRRGILKLDDVIENKIYVCNKLMMSKILSEF